MDRLRSSGVTPISSLRANPNRLPNINWKKTKYIQYLSILFFINKKKETYASAKKVEEEKHNSPNTNASIANNRSGLLIEITICLSC